MSTYPGGKNGSGVYQTLINLMPPHSVYIEAFLGSGAVLKYKKPARVANIAIDADAAVIDSFANRPGYNAICANAIDWMANLNKNLTHFGQKFIRDEDTLIYCDPPYLMSTRSSGRKIYKCEMTDEDHIRLLDVLLSLQCMVMISGYPSELYDTMLRGWRRVSYNTITRGGTYVQECVWCNFAEPLTLHDYRFLGSDFRERERIKRKITRWQNKLQLMEPTERYALMEAIEKMGEASRPAPSLITMRDSEPDHDRLHLQF